MAVNEHRQVALGECRLLMGDRVQRNLGFGDDFLAVAPCDVAMFGNPLWLQAIAFHA